jgi:hypothetical protein
MANLIIQRPLVCFPIYELRPHQKKKKKIGIVSTKNASLSLFWTSFTFRYFLANPPKSLREFSTLS